MTEEILAMMKKRREYKNKDNNTFKEIYNKITKVIKEVKDKLTDQKSTIDLDEIETIKTDYKQEIFDDNRVKPEPRKQDK